MSSIRTFLLSRLLGGAALVLAGAGVLASLFFVRSLEASFDDNLTDRLQALASILFQVEDHVEFEFSDQLMPEYDRDEAAAYFELRFVDGRLLERSNSLGEQDLELPVAPGATPVHWSAPLPDGREGRYVAQVVEVHHVFPEEGPDRPEAARLAIVVARDRNELIAAEREMLGLCALTALVLLLLIGVVAWVSVGRGLEPARRLAARVGAVRPDELPEGLDAGPLPRELEPVARKTDDLIRRLGDALERERRTTADIAHELRTPISEVLTVSEVALRNGHDPEAVRAALRTSRDVAWRLACAVSTILKLSRLEMGAERFEQTDVDLGSLLADLLRSLTAVERERRMQVHNLVPPGTRVEGDRDVLAIVASNLLTNALRYAPRGTTVDVALEKAPDDGWVLRVENLATDLRPEDLTRLSQPFWRKDPARADRDRSGLGLALSRALAEAAGMGLSFGLEQGRFRATLHN